MSGNKLEENKEYNVAVIGTILSGKTTFLDALSGIWETETQNEPSSNMLYLRVHDPKIEGRAIVFARIGLAGARHVSTFEQLVKINKGYLEQQHFLSAADVVIFILDHQRAMLDQNKRSLQQWKALFTEIGRSWQPEEFLFVANKSDLPNICSFDELAVALEIPPMKMLTVSCKTRQGISTFKSRLLGVLADVDKGKSRRP